jgi:hypothetical protein
MLPFLGRMGSLSGGSSRRDPPELRERAVRLVAEISDQHESERAAMTEVASCSGSARPRRSASGCARLRSIPAHEPR